MPMRIIDVLQFNHYTLINEYYNNFSNENRPGWVVPDFQSVAHVTPILSFNGPYPTWPIFA